MSRLTFRDAASGVAWQKRLRDQYADQGAPPIDLTLKRATVKEVDRRIAEQIILKYEWLGTMAKTNHHFGIFFGNYCAGVTCVAIGGGIANGNAATEWGLSQSEFACLARGANVHWSPPGANSKLVSWTCKLLSKNTRAKIIIAYSDTDAGEIGTIYQACNWVCVGLGSSTLQWVAPNGRVFDQRITSHYAKRSKAGWGEQRNAMLAAGWTQQESNRKLRYVYVLDKSDHALIDLVESKRVPYPKRANEATEDAGGDQPQKGGASPTRSLIQVQA